MVVVVVRDEGGQESSHHCHALNYKPMTASCRRRSGSCIRCRRGTGAHAETEPGAVPLPHTAATARPGAGDPAPSQFQLMQGETQLDRLAGPPLRPPQAPARLAAPLQQPPAQAVARQPHPAARRPSHSPPLPRQLPDPTPGLRQHGTINNSASYVGRLRDRHAPRQPPQALPVRSHGLPRQDQPASPRRRRPSHQQHQTAPAAAAPAGPPCTQSPA